MEALLDLGGGWLARAFAVYGVLFLLLPTLVFAYLPLLAALAWAVASHSRERQPWSRVPPYVRRRVRLAVEIVFGLLNPLLYLAILTPSLPALQSSGSWFAPLTTTAWILLMVFWTLQNSSELRSILLRGSRVPVYGQCSSLPSGVCSSSASKTYGCSPKRKEIPTRPLSFVLTFLRLSPLYLIPAVLIWDYIRQTAWFISPARPLVPSRCCVCLSRSRS